MELSKSKTKLPPALWALTICAFAIGTTELIVVGLLPIIAKDLKISIPHTGLLVTLYALGVAIGGPLITTFTNGVPRKKLLLGITILFILSNLIAALAKSFEILVCARILSGFAHGVFFGTGATIAGSLVAPEKRASAIAIMFAGLTVAMVTGIPLGTYIGQLYGWHAPFIGIVILGIIGFTANYFLLPANIPMGASLSFKDLVRVLSSPPILLVLAITALAFAGTFTMFTYLTILLGKITGFSAGYINIILLVYGIAIAIGNITGGMAANKNPIKALTIMFLLQAIVLLLLFFAIPFKILTIIVLFLMGILAFSNVPGLQLYIVQMAEKHMPGTENVASSLNIAAFNIGIALGAYTGGAVINSAIGLRGIIITGCAFVIGGYLLSLISMKKEKQA